MYIDRKLYTLIKGFELSIIANNLLAFEGMYKLSIKA